LNGDSVIAGNETGTHINRFDLAEYTEVTPEEIEEFLKRLYGDDFPYSKRDFVFSPSNDGSESNRQTEPMTQEEPPEETEDKELYIGEEVNEEAFNLVVSDEIFGTELKPLIPDKWKDKTENIGLLEWVPSTSGIVIGDYIIIKTYGDVPFIGNMQGPDYYLILSDNVFTELKTSGYGHETWYCVSDDKVHIYEHNFSSATHNIILTSYFIDTGEVSFLFNARYIYNSLDFEEWSILPPEASNIAELQEYMLGISDTWYTY
jgi:hypothetical protein